MKKIVLRMKGGAVCPPRKSFSKVAWSWLGAFLGIYSISILNRITEMDILQSMFLVGSFGASSVLIYGSPQADFSQPRNLVGGHIISAFIGISLQKYVQLDMAILCALAVSLSIAAMHFTRTIHPPGGATALIAVSGTGEIFHNGYYFVVSPIAIGAVILLLIALLVNNLSNNPLRHYPRYWF